ERPKAGSAGILPALSATARKNKTRPKLKLDLKRKIEACWRTLWRARMPALPANSCARALVRERRDCLVEEVGLRVVAYQVRVLLAAVVIERVVDERAL